MPVFPLLGGLATRIVAPLYPLEAKDQPILRLNPVLQIEGKPHYLAVQEVAALRVRTFGARVSSLSYQRPEIIAALGFPITGV